MFTTSPGPWLGWRSGLEVLFLSVGYIVFTALTLSCGGSPAPKAVKTGSDIIISGGSLYMDSVAFPDNLGSNEERVEAACKGFVIDKVKFDNTKSNDPNNPKECSISDSNNTDWLITIQKKYFIVGKQPIVLVQSNKGQKIVTVHDLDPSPKNGFQGVHGQKARQYHPEFSFAGVAFKLNGQFQSTPCYDTNKCIITITYTGSCR